MTGFDRLVDLLMFRNSSETDSHTNKPVITLGTIIWGVILRSSIIVVLSITIIGFYKLYSYWWWSLFILWFFAVYPAYRQFQSFNERMKKFEESTLCGSCKYFDSNGQLCSLYDEHVSSNYIPCEGESWEPKSLD